MLLHVCQQVPTSVTVANSSIREQIV